MFLVDILNSFLFKPCHDVQLCFSLNIYSLVQFFFYDMFLMVIIKYTCNNVTIEIEGW